MVPLVYQAAADTMAVSSLEVDLSGVEEGQTMTVKWRGKPVFIKHRTDAEIQESAEVALSELRDPQKDVDRAVNPKVSEQSCVCTHVGAHLSGSELQSLVLRLHRCPPDAHSCLYMCTYNAGVEPRRALVRAHQCPQRMCVHI